jgi:TolB-like protein
VLAHAGFESAVKDALRHFPRADLLVGNVLLQSRIVTGRGTAIATPQALRTLLAETAETLFANDRDQRLYRVLDLTYFHPAMGMPFSTYRRHLTAAVDRLSEWMWQQEQDASRTETADEQAADTASLRARRRLSIVILPFLNLSQDPGVDYLVDGIVDSLITDLSRALPGSFVISRSTAFSYKGRQVPVRQVGQELGVRYVLEGSVVADPSHVRVNVQLIDAQTDDHLWAERFDKERKDVFEVEDEIVGRLSRSIGIEMIRSEAARSNPSARNTDAVDLVMRARALANDVKRRENVAEAVGLFQRALGFDPDNVDALVGIATMCVYQVINLYQLEGRDGLLDEAEGLIARAMLLAPDHIGALKARAVLLRARGRFADAVAATATVITRNPGDPTAYKEMGLTYATGPRRRSCRRVVSDDGQQSRVSPWQGDAGGGRGPGGR